MKVELNFDDNTYTIDFGKKLSSVIIEVQDEKQHIVVHTIVFNADKVALELNQPPGIYCLIVTIDGKVMKKKIVKK